MSESINESGYTSPTARSLWGMAQSLGNPVQRKPSPDPQRLAARIEQIAGAVAALLACEATREEERHTARNILMPEVKA